MIERLLNKLGYFKLSNEQKLNENEYFKLPNEVNPEHLFKDNKITDEDIAFTYEVLHRDFLFKQYRVEKLTIKEKWATKMEDDALKKLVIDQLDEAIADNARARITAHKFKIMLELKKTL